MATSREGPARTMSGGPQEERTASDPWRAAHDFVNALAAGDFARLETCLSPRVRFRALVPSGLREREGAKETAALFRSWFEGVGRFEILAAELEPIAHRAHVRYRLREFYPDGDTEVIEQDAFCELEEDRISAMDLVCSGHLSEPKPGPGAVQRFDAGDLGCGSGLPQEFRLRMEQLPPGGVLEVRARDPSAKEDLPSLARLLGHRVLSSHVTPEGATILTVERGS